MKFVPRVWDLMKGSRRLYVVSLFIQVLMVVSTIFTSFLSKVLTDALTAFGAGAPFVPDSLLEEWATLIITFGRGPDYLLEHMYILPIALLASGVLAAIFSSLRVYLRVKASSSINKAMQMRLFTHLENLPYPYFKTHKSGDLLQTCTRDLDVLRRFLMMEVGNINYTLWMVGICFAVLLGINANYTLICMSPFPFMFVYSFFLIKKVRKLYRKNDDSEAKMTDKIAENLNAVRLVKAYHAEQYEIDRFEERLADYRKTFIAWRKFSSFFFSSTDIFVFGAKALSLVYGVYLLYTGAISGGTLVVGISFVNMMVWPLRGVAMNLSNLGQVLASVDRINIILETPAEDIDSGETPTIHGHLHFENVSFTYPDGDHPVLRNLSFDLPAGSTLAIMGKTGSGKSSLTGLLTRLYDYSEGSITLDGVELKDIQKRHLRHQVVPVLQDPFLFSKSIEENLLLGKPDSAKEAIEQAT
ncbi:MAG: ABC transporter ATP-binding protein, partial [Bacilli bacterium]|nr:ABC transporter ATP-binding protein [Bacilli bacterium]